MTREAMILRRTIVYVWFSFFTLSSAHFFSFDRLSSYTRYLDWETLGVNSTGNELWNGIMKDCSRRISFSCIQKNAYTYLDNTFVERDNFTVFEGFVLKRNKLDYETMMKRHEASDNVDENLVEASGDSDDSTAQRKEDKPETRIDEDEEETTTKHEEEYKTPLEEITGALREKTLKFLATRDYEVQLPEFFFEGSTVKISPREIDEKGALIRVDFGQRGLENEGRLFFKKIRKFLQNKLLVSFFALILIIKLIKVKFMFIIPFLFGVGTAKKLFLKLLLFLVPAFAHVFKLCSSYYTSNSNKYHHHHHQIAHHHHHVPVPVPVPTYFSPHNHHDHHHEEEYEGYDYAHPHIQLRKDMDELREWGIEPIEEPFDDVPLRPIPDHAPLGPVYRGNSLPIPQHIQTSRPPAVLPFQNKYAPSISNHAQNLAYNGYVDEQNKFNRRISPVAGLTISQVSQIPQVPQISANSLNLQLQASSPVNVAGAVRTNAKTPYAVYQQQAVTNSVPQQVNVQQDSRPIQQVDSQRVAQPQQQLTKPIVNAAPPGGQSNNHAAHKDPFYGPILERLEDIFAQLRFVEESCRERLICSMYKNPPLYSPHSNIVSNELSRDPQELKRGGSGSSASHRFYRYLNAARLGQDGGDCLRTFPCQINTE